MKKLYFLPLILFSALVIAQVPQQINYQGVARNSVGNVLPNKKISVRLSIREATGDGVILYSETRKITTNNFGLFNIAIGSAGTETATGNISSINWASAAKFLRVEIDPEGASNFLDMGSAQLLSVPYALYAGNSASSSPSGPAGGVLIGTYPNPSIANGAVTQSMIAPGVIPTSLPPNGAANGDLSGTYPDPVIRNGAVNTEKISDLSVTTVKLADGAVTGIKIAPGVIPTSLPPSGTAGGDLTGNYPNPFINNNAITTNKLDDLSVTTPKLADGAVTMIKIAPGVIPTSLPPSGIAGGDLTGNYPNPFINNNAITTNKLSDLSVTTPKLADGAVTAIKIAPGVIPTSLPPGGTAGGDLSGTYPNPIINSGAVNTVKLADLSVTTAKLVDLSVTTPKLADGAVTAIKIAPGVIPTSLPPGGTAGGDLTGTYPNPVINSGAVSTVKLADLSVTTVKLVDMSVTTPKLADGAVTSIKIAPGVIPTSLPPSGVAGGDLIGTYPNPVINSGAVNTVKLADLSVTTAKLVDLSVTTPKLADGAVTAIKIAPGVIPTSLPPGGTAGGDLTGTYPNPIINTGAVTTGKLADLSVTTGKLVDLSVTTPKLADGAVTSIKIAPGVIPTSLPPSGLAGGDLTGNYPNPVINTGAVTTGKLSDLSVTTAKLVDLSVTTPKLADGAVTSIKIAPGVIPTSLPPSGVAGGDLTGTYPNPVINTGAVNTGKLADLSVTTAKIADLSVTTPKLADAAVTNIKIADNAITTSKVLDASITMAKLGPDVILGGGSPTGPAGGDLSGTYPNPNLAAGSVTIPKIANGAVITPKIADGAVSTNKLADLSVSTGKLADNSVTTAKVVDGSITMVKLGPDVILGSGNPTGPAGGDLTGTYPNPAINTGAVTTIKLADNSVTTTKVVDASVTDVKLADNSVITSKVADASITGAKLAPGVIPTSLPPTGTAGGDLSGTYPNPVVNKIQGVTVGNTAPTNGQVLKYNGTQWVPGADNSGISIPYSVTLGIVQNMISMTNSGTGAGLEGINSSANANVSGVIGKISSASSSGSSAAVRGLNSGSGYGIFGSSVNGSGIYATSTNMNAGFFDISNTANAMDAINAVTTGAGNAVGAFSDYGNGLLGITYSDIAAGVLGYNFGGGEAVVGRNFSNTSGAVVGRNDGNHSGIMAISAGDNGTGLLAIANYNGTMNGNALVASIEGSGTGNPAVFKANGVNVARIDQNGKGYFNGGTQNSGADIAEAFDITGSVSDYEPGDVLVISTEKDRTVQKSNGAYSRLVAGVYATKPGVLLTEENIDSDLSDKVPMGVVGVIPTKVCLEGGNIQRGDLLVTSSIPGVAMKADLRKVEIGQVIGKALEDYNGNGIGKIKVLVSIK